MRIAVATLVRKLAADLRAEIARDEEISALDKARIEVNTLHAVARSIVERNHGTTDLPLRPHCRMVGTIWGEELIWEDVFCLHSEARSDDHPWSRLLDGLCDAELPTEDVWNALRETHLRLQQFYNALTFPDLILLATQVIREKPEFAQDTLFIFDEFQDFNLAEDGLIRVLTGQSPSLLLVGDDDQVLYDQLRRGHASIIRGYWENRSFVNAMLPYCIRCGFHICKAAEAFLAAGRSKQSIPKVFVSFHEEADAERVKVIAATSPNASVDYVTELLKPASANASRPWTRVKRRIRFS